MSLLLLNKILMSLFYLLELISILYFIIMQERFHGFSLISMLLKLESVKTLMSNAMEMVSMKSFKKSDTLSMISWKYYPVQSEQPVQGP